MREVKTGAFEGGSAFVDGEFVPLSEANISNAVFLTSSGGGIVPIAKIDGLPRPDFPRPIADQLYDAYWAIPEEAAYCDPGRYHAVNE